MAGEEHDFDRRTSDVNTASLAHRMSALEGRVEVLEEQGATANRELAANTRLTKQSNEAIFGAGDDPGMKAKVEMMHSVFEPARNGFRMLGKVGDGVMRVSDAVERRPKTTSLSVIGAVVGYSFATTGKLPDWFSAVMKALLA